MQKPALRKGQKSYEGLTLRRFWVDVATATQPNARCAERDAESLMPPTTPEASHALVEHVDGEATVDTGVMPQLGARTENAMAEDKVAEHLPKGDNEVDGDEDGNEADEASVGK